MSAPDVTPYKDLVGYVYVTDGVLPNPYDHLPPYLAEIARQLSGAVSNAKGEYIVTTRKSRTAIPFVRSSVDIRKLGTVSDSHAGLDTFSIQQNVAGKVVVNPDGSKSGYSYQNVLNAYPDRLTARLDIIDPVGNKIDVQHECTFAFLNIQTLREGFADAVFYTGLVGSQFKMNVSLIDINGIERGLFEEMLPGQYVNDIVSSYVTLAGEGNASQAIFGDGLSASIETTTDQNVTDLEALVYPFAEGGESVPMLSTNEGNNLYQTVTVDNGTQTTAEVFVGSWM